MAPLCGQQASVANKAGLLCRARPGSCRIARFARVRRASLWMVRSGSSERRAARCFWRAGSRLRHWRLGLGAPSKAPLGPGGFKGKPARVRMSPQKFRFLPFGSGNWAEAPTGFPHGSMRCCVAHVSHQGEVNGEWRGLLGHLRLVTGDLG